MKVYDKCCDGCLMGPTRIVPPARARQILADLRREGNGYFICHKATIRGEDVCCSAWMDKRGHESNLVRVMGRLGGIKTVPQPEPLPKETLEQEERHEF